MIAFLKTCGRGFIVIISSPLWLAFFALYIVYSFILFFYVGIKGFIKLFTSHHLTIETDYDRKAKAILSNPSFNPPPPSRTDIYPQTPVRQPYYPPQPPAYQPPPYQGQSPYPPRNNYNPNTPVGGNDNTYYPPRNNNGENN